MTRPGIVLPHLDLIVTLREGQDISDEALDVELRGFHEAALRIMPVFAVDTARWEVARIPKHEPEEAD